MDMMANRPCRIGWLLTCCIGLALGGDPSGTWEAYAIYLPEAAGNVTLISTTYTVPANPAADNGSTPKWWVGMQSTDGQGTLMKSQLTWLNHSWVINTEVLDYSLTPSVKVLSAALTVSPGDVIDASVRATDTSGASGAYRLAIGQYPVDLPAAHAAEV